MNNRSIVQYEEKEYLGLRVRYSPEVDDDGLLMTIASDGNQYIGETQRRIAKAAILKELAEAFEMYGFDQLVNNNGAMAVMINTIYDSYGELRFIDIKKAFQYHAEGIIKVDLTTYGAPLTVKQICDLLRPYKKGFLEFKKIHWLNYKKSLQPPPVAAPTPTVATTTTDTKEKLTRGQQLRQLLGVEGFTVVND